MLVPNCYDQKANVCDLKSEGKKVLKVCLRSVAKRARKNMAVDMTSEGGRQGEKTDNEQQS